MSDVGRTALAFMCIMGLAVMVYFFLTGTFLTGESQTAWQNAIAEPLEDVGVHINNFALFVAVSIIFGLGLFVPLVVSIIRLLS